MTKPENPADLPEVCGRRLLISHAEFERACRVLIGIEMQKLAPDNAITAALCNAVRLSREHVDYMKEGIQIPERQRREGASAPSSKEGE